MEALDRLQPPLEKILREDDFYAGQTYHWVAFLFHFGPVNAIRPRFTGSSKKHGKLNIDIAIEYERLRGTTFEEFVDIMTVLVIDGLLAVAAKYKCPTRGLLAERARYADKPALDRLDIPRVFQRPAILGNKPEVDEFDEVQIFIPLSDETFGTTSDRDLIDRLDHELEQLYAEAGTGVLDTRETGAGWCQFIICGKKVKKMKRTLDGWLKKTTLPRGSYLMLLPADREEDDAGERIDL